MTESPPVRPPARAEEPPPARAPHAPVQPLLAPGELAAAAWGVALLIVMSAFKWYGVDGLPGRSPVTAVDAWHGLTILSWLMAGTAALALASLALHVSQRRHGTKTDTSLVLAGISTVMVALLIYRVLIALPSPREVVDQKLGALLGLGCALALTVSAWHYVRAVRARTSAAA